MTKPTLEFLLDRTREDADCRIWRGSGNGGSVPTPKVRYQEDGVWKHASARRMAYEAYHGVTLGPGVLVTVTCGNSMCIEPEHLKKTNKGEVSRKSLARGDVKARQILGLERAKQPLGKLSHDKARELRARRDEDPGALAKEFNICRARVFQVWRGVAWRDRSNPFQQLVR